MADSVDLLAIAACTSIVGIVSPIVAEYAKSRFADHARDASLVATNDELKKRITNLESDLKSQQTKSQAKILEQQATLDAHFSRESIHLRFPLDPITGLRQKDGHFFCPQCFPEQFTEILPVNNKFTCDKCKKTNRQKVFIGMSQG